MILEPFLSGSHLKFDTKSYQNQVLHGRAHVFGPDLWCDPLKNRSKIKFWIKVMEKHFFTILEMLFSGTRTNIMSRK